MKKKISFVKPLVAAIFVFLSGLAIYLYFYLGMNKEAKLVGETKLSYYALFKEHIGPYHKINTVISEVEEWAAKNNIPCKLTFGKYLDSPHSTEEERLRSMGGCFSSTGFIVGETELPEGYKYEEVAEANYLSLTYDGSPAIGPMKAYPIATDWFRKKGKELKTPFLEVYKVINNKEVITTYYLPL